jgi:hypothetical protein
MNYVRAALLFLLATQVSADPIGDVRIALSRLTGREAIRATYELQRAVVNEGKFGNEKFNGQAVVELEADTSGFRMIVPRPLLDQIERERQAHIHDLKKSMPTVRALSQLDPTETSNAVDFAPELVRMLDGATLISDAPSTFQGKPARALVLRLADRLDEEQAGRVKVAENRLTLWLDSELVPVGAEHIVNARFSFLFFKGESKEKKSWYFAHIADRLVRVRHESSQISSGMGQKGNESVVAIVRVH